MVNVLYTSLFFISIVLLMVLIVAFKKRIAIHYVLLFAGVLVVNLGSMQLINTDTLKMALFANQIIYLGASFCPFFLFMCIADLCKTQVNRGYQAFLVIYGALIFALSSTVGVIDLYYKSVSLVQNNGYSSLIKEYGPLHTLYPLDLAIIMVSSVYIVVKAIKRKKDVSIINSVGLLVILFLDNLVYVIEKTMKTDIDIIPAMYILSELTILYFLRRISLYDVSIISADSLIDNDQFGFVLFDNKLRYLGADETAKKWFPEIRDLNIDAVVSDVGDSRLLNQIIRWISQGDNSEEIHIQCENNIVEVKHGVLRENHRTNIHIAYLKDDTMQQEYTRLIEKYNDDLEQEVQKKTEKLRNVQSDIILSMAAIVENRDSNTGGHIARTSDIIKIFVTHLKEKDEYALIDKEMARCIIKAAPLHDFGKIGIPDAVLNKPGKFEPEEYEQMKTHSEKGAVIVEKILRHSEDKQFKKIAINVAHYHHEKWDGTGYPKGLKENAIPFEARVMALADVFDALVSKRVYKESFSYDKAFSIIEESCGSHFDPELCKEFLCCRPQLEELYNSYED